MQQATRPVAEDLGVVPEYVRPLLARLGIPGFTIPMFERVSNEDRNYVKQSDLPELSLATWGTHDHSPIASFYDQLVKWWHGTHGHEGWLEAQRLMCFLGMDEIIRPRALAMSCTPLSCVGSSTRHVG